MKRARKSNRVSWAPGPNLCQVKLFLTVDCPSKVGQKSQDHLQAKTSSMLPSSTSEYNDDLPPGFEGNHFLNQSKAELSHISQIKWKWPPQFALSDHWRVAAGEESREKLNQKLREMRVLEAVYPRLSAIPSSPCVAFEVEVEYYDDNLTPRIPVIPTEEEDSMDMKPEVTVKKDSVETNTNLQQYISATSPISSQCNTSYTVPSSTCGKPVPAMSHGLDVDLSAASAVRALTMKSNEQGSLIDMDLLVKVFNDPLMIEKLIKEHRTAATTSSNVVGLPTSGLKADTSSVALSQPTTDKVAFGTAPGSSVGLLIASGIKHATPSVPLSRHVYGKSSAPSVTLPTPPPPPHQPTTALHMHRPVNKNSHHMSNGVLPGSNAHPPQQDTILSSGVNRVVSLPSVSSSELSTMPLPSACVNERAGSNQVPYAPSNVSAFAVKDANYYKNLIKQHGADKQDTEDSQIGIRHNNLQDFKPVHNIKTGEMLFKMQKPCIYFKSSRGCRNGSNCPYQHDDMPVQWRAGNVLLSHSSKRLKLGPEIKGRY